MKVWQECPRIAQQCQHSFSAKGVTQPEVKVVESESGKYSFLKSQETLKKSLGKKMEVWDQCLYIAQQWQPSFSVVGVTEPKVKVKKKIESKNGNIWFKIRLELTSSQASKLL